MRRNRIFGVISLLAHFCSMAFAEQRLEFQEGDILFHTSRSSQSLAIQLATHSPFSHMGILFYRKGSPVIYEAEGRVQWTPLADWIARGVGRHYVVMRLHELQPQDLPKLRAQADRYVGLPYDPYFEWTDDRMYCSELVWKVFEKGLGISLGAPRHLRDFDLTDPRVSSKLTERFGKSIPLEEAVIAPSDILNSNQLVEVSRQ